MAIGPTGGPMFNQAYFLLSAMSPVEAARILSVEIDLRFWLGNNRLELSASEIAELKAIFRA